MRVCTKPSARITGVLSLLLLALSLVATGCGFKDVPARPGDETPAPLPPETPAPAPDATTPLSDATVPDPDEGDEDVFVTPPSDWIADDDRAPLNTHLTYQNDPATTITVQWRTEDLDVERYMPRVWYARADEVREEEGDLHLPFSNARVASGSGLLFREYEMFGSGDQFVSWTVELTGLEPNTRYVYRAGTWDDFDEESGAFIGASLSAAHEFQTGPRRGASDRFTVMMAGDSRSGYNGIRNNIGRLSDMGADFWLFNGDMNEMGTMPEWDQWFGAMQPLLNHIPLMPVQGNHETLAWNYYAQFALPKHADLPEEFTEHAWFFDYGNTRFVGLNSVLSSFVEAQTPWLDRTLAEAAADPDIVWTVVMFHHPAYSASNHGSTTRIIEHWVPVLERHGVDLAFSGHDHNYERTHPVRGSQVVGAGQGVVYVVAGGFYSPGYSSGRDWWTVVSHHGNKGNYMHVEIDGRTLKATAYSGDGTEILDEFTLTKP